MLFRVRKDPEKGKVRNVGDFREFVYGVLLPRHLKWKGASDLKQLICCVRRVQKLGLYTRCFLLIVVAFILISIYQFFPVQISPGKKKRLRLQLLGTDYLSYTHRVDSPRHLCCR